MSEPRSNRLRRMIIPGIRGAGGLDPTRGGINSDLRWVGGLPLNTSHGATDAQLGPGAGGGRAVGRGIPDVSEHGTGCPTGTSNPASRSGAARFMVDEGHERTAASPPPRTTKHVAPFSLKPGHGNGED